MGQTKREFGNDTMVYIDYADDFMKGTCGEPHPQNTLTIQTNPSYERMNIIHEPRPDVAKPPLCSGDSACAYIKILGTVTYYHS